MLDRNGVLQTDEDSIKEESVEAYKYRLRNREIKPELKELQQIKEGLFKQRIKESKLNKTTDWTMSELNIVLNHLKKDASRDPNCYANEIFTPEVACKDLKIALLVLMNKI